MSRKEAEHAVEGKLKVNKDFVECLSSHFLLLPLMALCFAPSVKPKIVVENKLVGASRGSEAVLDCLVEGWPQPLTSWMRQNDRSLILSNHKYHLLEEREGYRTRMRLRVTDVSEKDFGGFHCVARNTQGEKEGFVRLFGP